MQTVTARIALELLAHEGLVREAYRDSQGIWTWSVGITNASGHRVYPRYLDKPQPLEHCLGVFLWLLRTRYLPPVLTAFGDHDPAEHELAAALSFHYNTGAIARAEWCRCFVAGDAARARRAFMNWARPVEIVPRRRRERDLFFHGAWTGDGTALLYDVARPSYRPVRGRRVEIAEMVGRLIDLETPAATPAPALAAPPVPPAPAPAAQAAVRCTAADTSPESWFDRLFGTG